MERKAARTDRLQELFARRSRQNEVRVRRDFFESLEERVCRRIVHAVGLGDNHHAHAVALHRKGGGHRTDEFHRNHGARAENIHAVRVLCDFFDIGLFKILDGLCRAPGRDVGRIAGASLFRFHRHDPVVGHAGIGCHFAAEAITARANARVCALERLGNFHRERFFANAHRTVDKNRLREAVLTQRRHKTNADSFLGGGAI